MQRVDERVGFRDPLAPRPLAQAVEQARGGGQADVGEQQRLLELFPRVVVDRAAAAHRGERAHECGARLAQPVAEAGRLDDLDLVDDLGLGFLDDGLGHDQHVGLGLVDDDRLRWRGRRRWARRRPTRRRRTRGRNLPLGIPALRAAGQTDAEGDERGREHEDSDDDEQG